MALSVHHGDNRALHAALASAPARSVVVCDAGGDAERGYFGELMARNALAGGIAGLVIDGAIRDSTAIASITFPVFSRAHAARPWTKNDRTAQPLDLSVGPITVRRGD